ncbi:MAG: hypothetical protein NWS34_01200 [Schleiferiaceae bacterium]|jgi:hypothetical protein|nr:hypothetical protein [Schleiferiaceae bacterium]MDP4628296.1 hypothetical protein [Schleiferiaceae bacterium]MDP4773829.1 hypothetical protein [Schleiferiaceae bacterium]MDP4932163.1 hypothetical protein [Schleiferiaceae bacterium]
MIRVLLFGALMLLQLPSALAQFSKGLTAGYHLADLRISFNPLIDPTFTPMATGRGGFHVGGYTRASAGLVYLQPQAWLTGLNQQILLQEGTVTPTVVDWSMLRLDFPVEVGVKLGPLFGFVAPVYSLALSESGGLGLVQTGTGSWGGQVGLGLKLGPLQASLRYEGSLSAFGDSITLGGIDLDTDNRITQIIGSVAVKL